MKIIAVIPAYNEASMVGSVVRAALPFVSEVVVIDDGSKDETAKRAKEAGACVYAHIMNRGLGATLATGISAALKRGADILITLDADGQHDPSEIPHFIRAIEEKHVDAVIGSRLLQKSGMPAYRRLYNWIGNAVTWALFGLWVTDSQSGFRAFTRAGASRLTLRSNRMEVSSEFIKEIRDKNISFCEIPCSVKYTDYSLSKGQSFFVGLSTAGKLLLRKLM
ncbi:glycosyltransferase family 2 protein [Candidatus Uhrbacteria bacterium]|nr:glycosyltransferase family 2 protein [Candidatus Uhrbacteria bacterium]